MIRMVGWIENTRSGNWRWFAHLWLLPGPGGTLRRKVQIGKLLGPRTGSFSSCRNTLLRTAARIGGEVTIITLVENEYLPSGGQRRLRTETIYRKRVSSSRRYASIEA